MYYRYIFVREDSSVEIEYAENISDAANTWYSRGEGEPQAIIRSIDPVEAQ